VDQGLRRDALGAVVLALALSLVWAWRDWSALAVLRLPDTDDVMRLQQVIDWLDGQAFGDLTQYRLGTGLTMHWSRLADLGPSAIMAMLTPIAGRHSATLVAVTVWPGLLFATALFLVARIAGATRAPTAMIVAAIAYPATTIFLPGRIDHHGLQVVLLLGAVLAISGTRARSAATAGLCAGASLIVGLETAPLLAAIGVVAIVDWIGIPRDRRLAAFGAGTIAGLLAGRLGFAGSGWTYPACDGFTAEAWHAAMIAAVATTGLGGIGGWIMTHRGRIVAAIVTGAIVASSAALVSPACLSPYGRVDPLLARLWLSQVGEAQSMLSAPTATAIGYMGMMVAGIAATTWQLHRTWSRDWAILTVVQVAALAVTTLQMRGAYAGAMLAAPALAAVIVAARRRGGVLLAGAWIASAGMVYPLAADAIAPGTAARPIGVRGDCASPAAIAALATLPRGVVLAPIDTGAWAIAATPHRLVAAPYHRNDAGNLAMYSFYRSPPTAAAAILAAWHVDYVMACATMPGLTLPGSTGAMLAYRPLPDLIRIATATDGTIIYRNRLSAAPASH
jgi:hypothetical protein